MKKQLLGCILFATVIASGLVFCELIADGLCSITEGCRRAYISEFIVNFILCWTIVFFVGIWVISKLHDTEMQLKAEEEIINGLY